MANYSLYTDGACSTSNWVGGVGLVIIREEQDKQVLVSEYSRQYKDATSPTMELLAVMHGLKSFKKPIDRLDIYTDSMYVIGCATLDYKRKRNLNYWKAFDEIYANVKKLCPIIEWHHVEGHAGDKWNEYCDKLAVKASKFVQ